MEKTKSLFFFFFFILILINFACKKETSKKAAYETPKSVESDFDVEKIKRLLNIQFKFLKTETIGYMTLHKFYWISLKEKAPHPKVEALAKSIIEEIITKKPKAYHSFTIHFFLENELEQTLESSKCFARANFLPEEGWSKVGRIPIDDYKNYRLTFTFFE